MMQDAVNPAVPSTAGALLAEEWTINPLATLPSFLEMFMMDEASRSARKSLQAGMTLLQQKLAEQEQAAVAAAPLPNTPDNDNQSTTTASSQSLTSSIAFLKTWLQRSSSKLAGAIARVMERFGPEISCLILFLLERQCLRSEACATISESLYGGRQAKLDSSKSSQDKQQGRKLLPLSDKDRTRLALIVALGPYLRHRLLLLYQKLKNRQQQSPTISIARLSLLKRLQKLFVWVYPLLHVSLSSLDLVYQWRYMLGYSVFFNPSAHVLGLVVRRVTQEDGPQNSTSPEPQGVSSQASTDVSSQSKAPTSMDPQPSGMRKAAVWALSSAVIISWITHFRSEYQRQRQALVMEQQRQQQQQEQRQGSQTEQLYNYNHLQADPSLPPPPSSGIKNAMPSHLCPLCRQPRVHPTASSSGFVFCYKCLLQHVQQTGQCPVTGRTCREAQLLRLYEPNHS